MASDYSKNKLFGSIILPPEELINKKIALINERKEDLIKHYPQLEQIYFIVNNRPAKRQYLIFINALAVIDNLDQKVFDGIINIADLRIKQIPVPVEKCKYMKSTGKLFIADKPCRGQRVICQNEQCPLFGFELPEGQCKKNKCKFFS